MALLERLCATCGRTFSPGRSSQVRCSRACRDSHKIANAKARRSVPEPKAGVCEWCGIEYASIWSVQRFCSPLCKQRSNDCRRYARKGAFSIVAAERIAIYERDDWTCQLCREPVDRAAHYLDNWAPSLDHITPRSQGGSDATDNLRLAHRWCNIVRSDGTTYVTESHLAPPEVVAS